jgi:hypothetical protein
MTYALCVDLADVGYPLGQHVAGHLIAIFVAELGGLTPGSAHRGPRICNRPRHYTSNRRREPEDMGHGGGVDELVLYLRQPMPSLADF